MNTKSFVVLAVLAVDVLSMMTSCGGTAKTVVAQPQPVAQPQQYSSSANPFGGGVYSVPGFEPDTEEYFTGWGTANGPKTRMDVLQLSALTNAQNAVRQKLKHAYKGMVSDYNNYMGNNNGSDAQTHMERAGDQIIDAVVNDTHAQTLNFSGVDEKGNVDCYIGIRVYKKQLADKIAKALSEEEELKVRFNESEFRKRMQESFKEYKENH